MDRPHTCCVASMAVCVEHIALPLLAQLPVGSHLVVLIAHTLALATASATAGSLATARGTPAAAHAGAAGGAAASRAAATARIGASQGRHRLGNRQRGGGGGAGRQRPHCCRWSRLGSWGSAPGGGIWHLVALCLLCWFEPSRRRLGGRLEGGLRLHRRRCAGAWRSEGRGGQRSACAGGGCASKRWPALCKGAVMRLRSRGQVTCSQGENRRAHVNTNLHRHSITSQTSRPGSPCWKAASCCTGVAWPAHTPLLPRLAGGGPGRGPGRAPLTIDMPLGVACSRRAAPGASSMRRCSDGGGSGRGAAGATGRGWPVARQWEAVGRSHQPLAALCGLTCGPEDEARGKSC